MWVACDIFINKFIHISRGLRTCSFSYFYCPMLLKNRSNNNDCWGFCLFYSLSLNHSGFQNHLLSFFNKINLMFWYKISYFTPEDSFNLTSFFHE